MHLKESLREGIWQGLEGGKKEKHNYIVISERTNCLQMVFDSSMRCRSPGFLWFISLLLFHLSFLWQDLSLCSWDWPWTLDLPVSVPQEVYGYALACLASLAHLRDRSPDLNTESFRFFNTIIVNTVPVWQECDLRLTFCKLVCAV